MVGAGKPAESSEGAAAVDMRLEVVVLPVSDADRTRDFYQALGWRLDADFPVNEGFRVVQMTKYMADESAGQAAGA
jgi:catechol 2,3-dioxygenase-like lactoylglutathione lyase family enzyme